MLSATTAGRIGRRAGACASRCSATSEPANVAASIAVGEASPAAAMSTPASAGPATCAMLLRANCRAPTAALSSSRSTSRGTSASSGGRRSAGEAGHERRADVEDPEVRVGRAAR